MNRILAGGNALKAWGLTKECERSCPCCLVVYLINLVARASTSGAMVTPICFAVLRLTMKSGGRPTKQEAEIKKALVAKYWAKVNKRLDTILDNYFNDPSNAK